MTSSISDMNQEIKALNPLITDPKRCGATDVPELLKPNCRNFSMSQSVDTSVLNPIVSRPDYIRWTLDRKGILHSNSKISLKMKLVGDSHKAFLPFPTGIKSIIKKCVLRAGTTILDSTDSYNVLSAYENLMISGDTALRKERIKSGMVNSYKSLKVPSMSSVGVANGKEDRSQMSVDVGKEFELSFDTNTGTSTRADDKVPTTVHANQNLVDGSEFILDLADLFTSLRLTQLPLWLIDQPVIIELFLEPKNTSRLCTPQGQANIPEFIVDPDSPLLIADYIYYDAETMNQFAENNKFMELPFFEHQLINTNVNYHNGNGTPSFTRNLGGASKAVASIKICHTDLTGDLSDSLINRYKSDVEEDIGGDRVSYNVKINDRFLFPVKISNPSEQYVNSMTNEGMALNLTGRDYVKNLGCKYTTKELIELHDQEVELAGSKRWMSIFNVGGERINNRGIELHIDVTSGTDKNLNQLVWIQMSKTLELAGGRFREVYN